MEIKAKDMCPRCKHCLGMTPQGTYSCGYADDGSELNIGIDVIMSCTNFEWKDEEVLYKTRVMYSVLKMEKEELEAKVTELIKASKRKDELIQDYREKLKKANDENGTIYEDLEYWKERCHKAETDVTTLNSKVEVLKNKSDKYLNKIINQQTTHYKQCARILELENMVSKLQSGEYDDILAKDIEIKSLQAKYEDAMAGWKDAIDTNDKQIEEFTRRYNMIAKKLNDIHDILKEESDNE